MSCNSKQKLKKHQDAKLNKLINIDDSLICIKNNNDTILYLYKNKTIKKFKINKSYILEVYNKHNYINNVLYSCYIYDKNNKLCYSYKPTNSKFM